MALAVTKTRLGKAIRAVSQDREIANLMGINVNRIFLIVMGISVGLAGLAGAVIAPIYMVSPLMWIQPLTIVLASVVLGGLGSVGGMRAGRPYPGLHGNHSHLPGAGRGLAEGCGFHEHHGGGVAGETGRPVRCGFRGGKTLAMTYLLLWYGWFRGEILAIPGRVIAMVFFLALFCAPLITQDPYFLRIITLATIFAIFAASWDVLSGFTGQVNLGHALFFGVAGYMAGLLNTHLNMSPWLTIPLGALTGVAVGLIAGIPALRLRGIYLGLVTLTFLPDPAGRLFHLPRVHRRRTGHIGH